MKAKFIVVGKALNTTLVSVVGISCFTTLTTVSGVRLINSLIRASCAVAKFWRSAYCFWLTAFLNERFLNLKVTPTLRLLIPSLGNPPLVTRSSSKIIPPYSKFKSKRWDNRKRAWIPALIVKDWSLPIKAPPIPAKGIKSKQRFSL